MDKQSGDPDNSRVGKIEEPSRVRTDTNSPEWQRKQRADAIPEVQPIDEEPLLELVGSQDEPAAETPAESNGEGISSGAKE